MIASPSDLCYFVEVANTLNISRAAERAGISQPSLTLAMQRLEEAIGTPLLCRSKSGVTLTQAGKQLLEHTKQLLHLWAQVKGQALASTNEIQGSYTIGCHPSVALYSLGTFLPNLLEQYEDLNIKLVHDLSRKIVEGVISFSIDLGIAVNPIHHPDLVIRKICTDEVTFWSANQSQDLQRIKSQVATLICDPELLQVQVLLKKLYKEGYKIKRIVPSSNLEVITMLVANGCGIGILPTRVAKTVRNQKLQKIENFPFVHDEICLLYRLENKNVKTIQVIAKAVMSSMVFLPEKNFGQENLQSFST